MSRRLGSERPSRSSQKPKALSPGEEQLALQIRAVGLPAPVREHRFHPTRKFRFDFAWPDRRPAAEVEGGTRSAGRHVRAAGYAADCSKYNYAVLLGWRVLRFTTAMVRSGEAIRSLSTALKGWDDR